MNNINSLYQTLRQSMQTRWPHDHLLFLWLAPVTTMLAVFLHISMPWEQELFPQVIATLSLLSLPGALLLQWFAPRRGVVATFLSPQYKFWKVTSHILTLLALVGFGWGWFHASPLQMSLSLGMLTFSQWMPQLQPHVLITQTHTWHLGFPINISLKPDEKESQKTDNSAEKRSICSHQDKPLLGTPIPRGHWRLAWFLILWIVWSYRIGSLTFGANARLPEIWSLRTLLLWGLGSLICFQLSRLPPSLRAPREAQYLWKDRSPAWASFIYISVPSCLITLALCLTSISQQLFVASKHQFHAQIVFFDLLLSLLALTLLFDPSGSCAWIAQKDKTLYLRRFGWIEEIKQC